MLIESIRADILSLTHHKRIIKNLSIPLPTLQSSKINKVKMLLKGLKLVFAFTTNNTNDELAEKKTRVAKNYTSSTVPRDFSFRKQTGSESLSTSPGKKSE